MTSSKNKFGIKPGKFSCYVVTSTPSALFGSRLYLSMGVVCAIQRVVR